MTKSQRGSKSRILEEDAIDYLIEKVEQRPDITSSEKQQMLQVYKGINVSISQ